MEEILWEDRTKETPATEIAIINIILTAIIGAATWPLIKIFTNINIWIIITIFYIIITGYYFIKRNDGKKHLWNAKEPKIQFTNKGVKFVNSKFFPWNKIDKIHLYKGKSTRNLIVGHTGPTIAITKGQQVNMIKLNYIPRHTMNKKIAPKIKQIVESKGKKIEIV